MRKRRKTRNRPRRAARGLWCAAVVLCAGVAVGSEADRQVTVIVTGEQIGRLGPCGCTEEEIGGLARRATVIQRLRKETPGDVVLLDNGAIVFEGGRQQELKFDITMQAMAEMDYAAMGVGFRDLSLGMSMIEAAAIDAPFPVIASNLVGEDGVFTLARSAVVETPSGVRIGVLSIIGEDFDAKIRLMATGVRLLDPLAVVREFVTRLAGQTDLVVLLSHTSIEETRRFVEKVDGIALAVTGYLVEKPFEKKQKVNDTLLVGTGLYGKWMARATLVLDASGRVTAEEYAPVYLAGHVKEDPGMLELLEDYRVAVIEERLIEHIPRAPLDGPGYVGTYVCMRCHRPQALKWITTHHAVALASLKEDGYDKDPECVVCHVVGLDRVGGFRSPRETPALADVACEECHGPGAWHARNVLAPYYRPTVEDCRTCHDPENSPQFVFEEYYPKMDHRRTTLEQAAKNE